MTTKPHSYLTDRVKKLEELWKRIEKTMTGHISGRRIWDADTKGNDDEANYLFVDETLKAFLTDTIQQSMEVGREMERKESVCKCTLDYIFKLGGNKVCGYCGKLKSLSPNL